MGYRVAVDDHGETGKAYVIANGINTIPHAFLIDQKGNLVWHGNPLDDHDQQLARLLQ